MEQLGAGSRTEGVEAFTESALDLLQVHWVATLAPVSTASMPFGERARAVEAEGQRRRARCRIRTSDTRSHPARRGCCTPRRVVPSASLRAVGGRGFRQLGTVRTSWVPPRIHASGVDSASSCQTARLMRLDGEDATSTIRPSSAIPDRSSDRVASRSGMYSTTIV